MKAETIQKSSKTKIWFFENIHQPDTSLARLAKQREDTNDQKTGRGDACQHRRYPKISDRMPGTTPQIPIAPLRQVLVDHFPHNGHHQNSAKVARQPGESGDYERTEICSLSFSARGLSSGADGFTCKFYETYTEEITPISTMPPIKQKTENLTFYEARTTLTPKPNKDHIRKDL